MSISETGANFNPSLFSNSLSLFRHLSVKEFNSLISSFKASQYFPLLLNRPNLRVTAFKFETNK